MSDSVYVCEGWSKLERKGCESDIERVSKWGWVSVGAKEMEFIYGIELMRDIEFFKRKSEWVFVRASEKQRVREIAGEGESVYEEKECER